MAYSGKIAFNLTNVGKVNYDCMDIKFLPANANTPTSINDFVQVNKVYAIPAGVTVTSIADLQNYVVWELINKTLVAGTLTVCIEYVVPNGENDTDINLSSFGIFTADSESSTTVNVGIFHESGIVVYKSNVDNIDHNTSEKYGLTGERRLVQSISNVVLKKGLKYYIQYTNTNNSFKPAYFSEGSGNYLNWRHGSLQQKSVADLNSVTKYLGVVSNVATWLAASENALMICDNGLDSLSNSDAYIRNNLCNGASIIGQNGQTLPAAEKDKILKLNTNDGFMYIGNNYSESDVDILQNQRIYIKNSQLDNTKYKGIKTTAKGILDDLIMYDYCIYSGSSVAGGLIQDNRIYQKTADIDVKEEYQCAGSNMTDALSILDLSYNASGDNKSVATNGYLYWSDITGNVYTLKSGYVPKLNKQSGSFVGYASTEITSGSAGDLFYITTTGYVPLINASVYETGLFYYDGNGLTLYCTGNSKNNFDSLFTIVSMSDAVQEIKLSGKVDKLGTTGQLIELVKTHYDGAYISNNLRGETVQTDKKFYLEINGREV